MNTRGWSRREVLTGAVGAAASAAILGATGASCTTAYAEAAQQQPVNSATASGEQTGASLRTTAARNAKLYKPGDAVPTSGIYEATHDKLDGSDHAQPHPVIAVSGKRFPPCRVCLGQARFRLLQAADFVDADNHFKS
jgi:hypothetical protein